MVNMTCLSRKVVLLYGQLPLVASLLPDVNDFANSGVCQQYKRCAMLIHVVTVVISFFFLDTFSWHQEGRSGLSHGVGLRSSCQDSCIRRDYVLTLVEGCRRVEFA